METYIYKGGIVMKKKKINTLKALGVGATVFGLAASLFSSFVEDKKTDAKITEKVNEAVTTALAKKEN